MLSKHRLAPLALLLAAAGPILAEEPRPFPTQATVRQTAENPNQLVADGVARELRASPALQNFHMDVLCLNGLVELRGRVADAAQRDQAVRLAQAVPGVTRVVSNLQMAGQPVTRAQFEAAAEQAKPDSNLQPDKAPTLIPAPRRDDGDNRVQEPVPSFRAPMPPPDAGAGLPPPMPPYAWPSYAPYNNYSRVAYPLAYPCEAFPLIGPVYPFPKTPLSWRKVTLQWDDGHWWLQANGGKRDWWVLRYW
jgi:hypothetical protein